MVECLLPPPPSPAPSCGNSFFRFISVCLISCPLLYVTVTVTRVGSLTLDMLRRNGRRKAPRNTPHRVVQHGGSESGSARHSSISAASDPKPSSSTSDERRRTSIEICQLSGCGDTSNVVVSGGAKQSGVGDLEFDAIAQNVRKRKEREERGEGRVQGREGGGKVGGASGDIQDEKANVVRNNNDGDDMEHVHGDDNADADVDGKVGDNDDHGEDNHDNEREEVQVNVEEEQDARFSTTANNGNNHNNDDDDDRPSIRASVISSSDSRQRRAVAAITTSSASNHSGSRPSTAPETENCANDDSSRMSARLRCEKDDDPVGGGDATGTRKKDDLEQIGHHVDGGCDSACDASRGGDNDNRGLVMVERKGRKKEEGATALSTSSSSCSSGLVLEDIELVSLNNLYLHKLDGMERLTRLRVADLSGNELHDTVPLQWCRCLEVNTFCFCVGSEGVVLVVFSCVLVSSPDNAVIRGDVFEVCNVRGSIPQGRKYARATETWWVRDGQTMST